MQLSLSTEKMMASIDNGIGRLVFNNPAKRNAMSLEMWRGVEEIMHTFADSEDVRVIVMSGAGGKAFVSGADISEFDQKRSNIDQQREYNEIAAAGNRALIECEKPLLAEINGFCIGGGMATALAADIRFATPDSQFGIPAAKLGLGYQYDPLAKISRVVGPARARDILFSGRFLPAEEALDIGLINFVVESGELGAAVAAYAERLAANAPLTIRAAKAAINVWERGGREDERAAVQELIDRCFDSTDYAEGRRAFAKKRTPQFRGQ